MLRLALGTIAVSRRLLREAGMANSPSSDPLQSGGDRQAAVLVVDDPTPQIMILDDFVDNNIQALLARSSAPTVASVTQFFPVETLL
jgi:hypothetical protein